jgi:hypothetical protein
MNAPQLITVQPTPEERVSSLEKVVRELEDSVKLSRPNEKPVRRETKREPVGAR